MKTDWYKMEQEWFNELCKFSQMSSVNLLSPVCPIKIYLTTF